VGIIGGGRGLSACDLASERVGLRVRWTSGVVGLLSRVSGDDVEDRVFEEPSIASRLALIPAQWGSTLLMKIQVCQRAKGGPGAPWVHLAKICLCRRLGAADVTKLHRSSFSWTVTLGDEVRRYRPVPPGATIASLPRPPYRDPQLLEASCSRTRDPLPSAHSVLFEEVSDRRRIAGCRQPMRMPRPARNSRARPSWRSAA